MPTYSLTTWQAGFTAGNDSLALPVAKPFQNPPPCAFTYSQNSRIGDALPSWKLVLHNTAIPQGSVYLLPGATPFPSPWYVGLLWNLSLPSQALPCLPQCRGSSLRRGGRRVHFWHLCSRPSLQVILLLWASVLYFSNDINACPASPMALWSGTKWDQTLVKIRGKWSDAVHTRVQVLFTLQLSWTSSSFDPTSLQSLSPHLQLHC